jgi:hypothetical protein
MWQNISNYFSKFGDFLILEREYFDRIFWSYFDFRPKKCWWPLHDKLEKEKLDWAAFCFQQFFCSFDKKIWKKFGIFFHSVNLTNLSIFLKEFTKFLHHKIGKKIPYWEELIFSWVLPFPVSLSLFPFHYCWLPQFNENRRWWLMDDLYYSSQKEEQNSFEGCSSSY